MVQNLKGKINLKDWESWFSRQTPSEGVRKGTGGPHGAVQPLPCSVGSLREDPPACSADRSLPVSRKEHNKVKRETLATRIRCRLL